MDPIKTKHFTPAEAMKTLPLVKRIVRDILNNGTQIREIFESTGGEIEGNTEVERLSAELNHYLHELEELGCYYKDWNFEIGLVDFPAIIDGNEVYLCWRSDEEEILFYHGIDEGYAGRKKISPHIKV
ncbi:MAG: DUF2203 domain-containing protein [bacterium]